MPPCWAVSYAAVQALIFIATLVALVITTTTSPGYHVYFVRFKKALVEGLEASYEVRAECRVRCVVCVACGVIVCRLVCLECGAWCMWVGSACMWRVCWVNMWLLVCCVSVPGLVVVHGSVCEVARVVVVCRFPLPPTVAVGFSAAPVLCR
jgi:hypothetical protein